MTRIQVLTCAHTHTHIHTYTHTCTQMHIHMHTPTCTHIHTQPKVLQAARDHALPQNAKHPRRGCRSGRRRPPHTRPLPPPIPQQLHLTLSFRRLCSCCQQQWGSGQQQRCCANLTHTQRERGYGNQRRSPSLQNCCAHQ